MSQIQRYDFDEYSAQEGDIAIAWRIAEVMAANSRECADEEYHILTARKILISVRLQIGADHERCKQELLELLREWSGTGIADCHCWNTDLRKRTDAALEAK
jgi:hypothetical protein